MSDIPTDEPVPSSSEKTQIVTDENEPKDEEGPLTKKRKVAECEGSEKLEHRLGGILCCAVCLDLPPAAVYQCTNGHLMCAPCFTHLLADARLRDEAATCPNCRVEISKTSASRNLAVEKTVSELPSQCKFCTGVFPRHSLLHHEQNTCEDRRYKSWQLAVGGRPDGWAVAVVRAVAAVLRLAAALPLPLPLPLPRAYLRRAPHPHNKRHYQRLTGCRYAVIGCRWVGPAHEAAGHEADCPHPARSAHDVIAVLKERDLKYAADTHVYTQLLELLSYEKITFNDLQLKPYRTEEFVHKLYYETSRFSAFGHQWVVKAFVNRNQRDPTQSSQREITYQIILKTKTAVPLNLQWVLVRGPFGEAGLGARVWAHQFAEERAECAPLPLPLADPADTNRLLATKAIHFRLIMFLSSK